MGKKIALCAVILLCALSVPSLHVMAADTIENNESGIPDRKLYKAISKKLGKKPNQTFTKQEAETIRSFDVNNKSIKSLKGIYYLSKLEKLDVSGNKLKNLKGVEKLSRLKKLNASDNELKDLKPLKKLKKLTSLDVSGNFLVKLNGIEKLSKLKIQ